MILLHQDHYKKLPISIQFLLQQFILFNAQLKRTAKSLGEDKNDYRSSVAKFHGCHKQLHQMNETELGQYLRSNGILRQDLDSWKKICESANEAAAERAKLQMSEIAKQKAKVRQLESQLRRKDKALAEAAALLVLRKKADAIWGDNEDD